MGVATRKVDDLYPAEFGESGVVIYRAERFGHDEIEGKRVTQLGYEAAQQLQRKLARVFLGREIEDPDPDMTDHWVSA